MRKTTEIRSIFHFRDMYAIRVLFQPGGPFHHYSDRRWWSSRSEVSGVLLLVLLFHPADVSGFPHLPHFHAPLHRLPRLLLEAHCIPSPEAYRGCCSLEAKWEEEKGVCVCEKMTTYNCVIAIPGVFEERFYLLVLFLF